MKTDKIWLCESVDELKVIGKHGEAKMNGTNIHTIADLQRYIRLYGFPKLLIRGFGQFYEHGLEDLPRETDTFHQRPQESELSAFLEIWREMSREVKVIILHAKILIYH